MHYFKHRGNGGFYRVPQRGFKLIIKEGLKGFFTTENAEVTELDGNSLLRRVVCDRLCLDIYSDFEL